MATALLAPERPLCVDMDGTLVGTDLLWESLLILIKTSPRSLPRVPFWLLRGKAYFKRMVAERVTVNPASLPYRADVVSFLREEQRAGRQIILATAADETVARQVADHLGLFTAVIASDGRVNVSGKEKLGRLQDHCGDQEFDYIGNSRADLPIWGSAKHAHLVDPDAGLLRRTKQVAQVGRIFRSQRNSLRSVVRALRVHQWIKNLLLFVPLVLSHEVANPAQLFQAVCAFLIFGLCASSVYVVNDLLDLEADRLHPNKRNRPFASGALSIPTGILLGIALLTTGVLLSLLLLPPMFTVALSVYLLVATSYSLFIKRIELLDVFVLAALYTLRVVSGGVAVGVVISPWLYAFSMFLFTSLAFLKRYAELQALDDRGELAASGRGYAVGDLSFLRSVGPTCGLLAVLILSLYINSKEVLELYRSPALLWLAVAPLAYWITHLWFVAHRGRMHDDPIVFTVKDPTSYMVGACVVAVMAIASF